MSPIVSRFSFQRICTRFFTQNTSSCHVKAIKSHISQACSLNCKEAIPHKIVKLPSPKNSKTSNTPWILFAIALVAAILAKTVQAEAEEDLSREELEEICKLLGIETNNQESFEDLAERCFHGVFHACLKGNWFLVDQISPKTLSKLSDRWGQTLLISAAKEGQEAVVQALIRRKIALYKKDHEGNNPLHAAAKNGFSHLIPILSDYYIKDKNNQGKNAHHLAIEYGHIHVLAALIAKQPFSEALKEDNIPLSLLAVSIKHSRKDCLDYLLKQYGNQLQENTPAFGSLLHVAIHFGQLSMLKHLIGKKEAALLLKRCDNQERNPLAFACYRGDLEIVEFLYGIYRSGERSKEDCDGTAIHWAVKGKQLEVIKLLDYLGVDLEARDREGNRPEDLLRKDKTQEAIPIRNVLNNWQASKYAEKENPLNPLLSPQGIVFKGGGPRGLAYLEALRTLNEKKKLELVYQTAGTSAGAITACIFALDPKLSDINSLENLDLMQFLDPIKGKEPLLNAMLASNDKEGFFPKLAYGGFEFTKGAWNPLKLYQTFSQLEGICKGDAFLNWIENEVHTRTEIEHCTFRELREEKLKGKDYLHLHVYAARINAGPELRLLEFHSKGRPDSKDGPDPDIDNIVISDAIRASMSIPGLFEPYIVREKKQNGALVPRTDLGPCVDGGVINNFPINAFDPKVNGFYSGFNRRTLGLCLKDVEEPSEKAPATKGGILNTLMTCASIYWTTQETYIATEENRHRMIEIPIKGVGLFDFNMSKEQKDGILKSGRTSVENSPFGKVNEEHFFDYKKKPINLGTPLLYFIERQEEMRGLEKILQEKPSQYERVVRCIYGSPGMGKTELTRTFAKRHEKDFSFICFINSESKEKRIQSYRLLAEELGIPVTNESPESIERTVHSRLQKHTYEKPWLLIYDNVEEKIPLPLGGYILMTAQNRELWSNPDEQIHISTFSQEQSVAALTNITGKSSPRMGELAKELGHFPLAITQAARYIKYSTCDIEKYLTDFKKNPLHGQMTQDERYQQTLHNVWNITLKKLEEKNPKAFKWLKICSHLNPDHVPQEWLEDWLKTQPNAKNWDDSNITKTLLDLSLIESKGENYSIHRLMQLVVRETADDAFKEAFEVVTNQHKKLDDTNWKQTEEWVIQAIKIGESQLFKDMDIGLKKKELLNIQTKLSTLGYHLEALEYSERSIEVLEKAFPPDHPELAGGYNSKATCLISLGQNQEALKYFNKATDIWEKKLLAVYSILGYTNKNLYIINLKQFQEKLGHSEEATEIWENLLKIYSNLAVTYTNKGLCLTNLKQFQAALEFSEKAVEISEEMLPEDYELLTIGYNNKGFCLGMLGRHKDALDQIEKFIKGSEKLYPPNHPSIARGYSNKGVCLIHLEQFQEALECFEKTGKIRKKALPPDHLDLAFVYHDKSKCLNKLGRHQEALKSSKKALKHPSLNYHLNHDKAFLKNFIEILNNQSDLKLAESEKQEILSLFTPRLGKEHPLIQELEKAGPKNSTNLLQRHIKKRRKKYFRTNRF